MAARKQFTLTFSQPQEDWLRAEAEKLGIGISEFVRRLIDQVRSQAMRSV